MFTLPLQQLGRALFCTSTVTCVRRDAIQTGHNRSLENMPASPHSDTDGGNVLPKVVLPNAATHDTSSWEMIRSQLLPQSRQCLDLATWGMNGTKGNAWITPPRSPNVVSAPSDDAQDMYDIDSDESSSASSDSIRRAYTDDPHTGCLGVLCDTRIASHKPIEISATFSQDAIGVIHHNRRGSLDSVAPLGVATATLHVCTDEAMHVLADTDESMMLAPSPCGSPTVSRRGLMFSEKDLQHAFERHHVMEMFGRSSTWTRGVYTKESTDVAFPLNFRTWRRMQSTLTYLGQPVEQQQCWLADVSLVCVAFLLMVLRNITWKYGPMCIFWK